MEQEVEELKEKLRETQQQLAAEREAEKLHREQVWEKRGEAMKHGTFLNIDEKGTEKHHMVGLVSIYLEIFPQKVHVGNVKLG